MDAKTTFSIPITRPQLPPVEQFTEIVAEIFETRMLSNFAKYSRLLEEARPRSSTIRLRGASRAATSA